MIIVKFTVPLALLVTLCAGTDETSNELVSNVVEDPTPVTVTSIVNRDVDRQPADAKSNTLPNVRRSRYLRHIYRPPPRPPFDMRMRNARRPPYPMYPNRYHYKSPLRPYPPSKSRYRYHENWRHKWPEQNQPYGPYSAMNDDEDEAEPYDEYDEMDDSKTDEPWLSKKYRDSYDDAMPLSSSKYTEKRSPTRYLNNVEMLRSRARPTNYDLFESLRKESHAAWLERNRVQKNYRELLELLGAKKALDSYDDAFPANRYESHRFKMANLARFKNLEDDYDFSATNGLKFKRPYKNEHVVLATGDQSVEKPSDESRYEQEVRNVAKYVAAHHSAFPAKLELPQEVVYSAKYRGKNDQHKDEAESKTDADQKLKVDDPSTTVLNDVSVWKQQPTYTGYLPDKMGDFKSETNIVRGKPYKPDHLLPSDLIAYMSASPTEHVVGKEERYIEPTYPYDVLKAVFPNRKISPVIDHDLEITFDERMSDWKH